ncbi:hypothetical protein Patl1_06186 [Pistacia atlantica]|uniref:Uncharacterized protein n=1 Tax=Pistacia atlantica TaxID=434234 RepID=A0ACC1BQS7_9ROSI|nr:hypothetical protein Patl1_06186 [Pistacia atlantica]
MANKKQAADFEPLRQLVRHHIESFDYMVDEVEALFEQALILEHFFLIRKALEVVFRRRRIGAFLGSCIENGKGVEVVSRNISRVPFDKCFVLDKYFLDRKGASSCFWTTSLVLFEEVLLKKRNCMGNPEIFPPQKEHGSKSMRDVLLPFECRQAKISYTGKLMADVEFQYDDSAVIREKFNFGQFPIMLKSKRCHLRDADPQKLKSFKEEASEVGGYFILNGLERVFRAVILQKQNYPMSMVRNSFRDRREGYTNKAVVLRCVRKDQSSVSVKLYYLRNGSARLGFWMQGKEYLLPVGIVLKSATIIFFGAYLPSHFQMSMAILEVLSSGGLA